MPQQMHQSQAQAHIRQQQVPRSQQPGANLYQGQKGDGGGTPDTAPFLQDFNLLAEAAKRAQMAVLMRDMGDVELS